MKANCFAIETRVRSLANENVFFKSQIMLLTYSAVGGSQREDAWPEE